MKNTKRTTLTFRKKKRIDDNPYLVGVILGIMLIAYVALLLWA